MTRVARRAVGLFVLIALGLAWLVMLPVELSGRGLADPIAGVLVPLMMLTPTIAAVVVSLAVQRVGPRALPRHLGLWPIAPVRRTVGYAVLGALGIPVVVLAGIAVAAAFGAIRLDPVGLSNFRALLAARHVTAPPVPLGVLALLQLVSIPFFAVLNGVLAVWEEIGWRGWLLPALLPLGGERLRPWPGLLGSGAIWGAWHAPLLILGYDFGLRNGFSIPLMIVACALYGTLLGWLRLRSGTIWPSVVAHGALNASGGLSLLLAAAGGSGSLVASGPVGWATWIVLAAVVAVLAAAPRLRPPQRPETTGEVAGT